jgi:antitoxin HicB
MTDTRYPVVIIPLSDEDGGGFMAYAPDLKGCMGDGSNQAEALTDVQRAIDEWIAEATRLDRTIPEPFSSIERARSAREKLIAKIEIQSQRLKAQSAKIEELDSDIQKLSAMLEHLASRMLNEPDMWAGNIPYLPKRHALMDTAVH